MMKKCIDRDLEVKKIIAEIEAASDEWKEWDWTMDFGEDRFGTPIYFSERPDDNDKSEGADAAREYADEVEAAARYAADYGDIAIRHLLAGEFSAALRNLELACEEEYKFGAAQTWSVPREMLDVLIANGHD